MFKAFQNIFNIPDLRKRVIYTLILLAIFRVGAHIPVPGINTKALSAATSAQAGTLFAFIDMFSGGAFKQLSIFALGIMPYISASIILQLLTVVIPYLERLQKEGEAGRKKIVQYTRYGTIFLTAFQAWGLSLMIRGWKDVVISPGLGFQLMMVITVTAGTAFLMWLGEQITEKGIGNGISLIIFAGIVARMPVAIENIIQEIKLGQMNIFSAIMLALMFVAVSAAIVVMTQGQRRLTVQHAQRVVGRRIMGGTTTYLPLRLNHAGVIPIIFASSILYFPATIAQFFGSEGNILHKIATMLSPSSPYSLHYLIPTRYETVVLFFILKVFNLYTVMYVLLIIFFCYFYTAVTFNPVDTADNLKKYGAFIPGVRPGKSTSDLIDRILTRITLAGAFFLALVAIIPETVNILMDIPYTISSNLGGTGLIIVVGVALDTMKQIESHLLMRHYDGFLKKGKLKSRSW